MRMKILIVLSVLISLSFAYAEDPFSRSFSTPSTVTGDLTLTDDGSDAVHPMMKYDVAKYFVKGVIVSLEGSIAVMSIPGGKDYVMFPGDPIGNDLHTIKSIDQDYIIVGKNSSDEEIIISVSNPLLATNLSGM